jgi:hypothetical protein
MTAMNQALQNLRAVHERYAGVWVSVACHSCCYTIAIAIGILYRTLWASCYYRVPSERTDAVVTASHLTVVMA